MDIYLDTVLVLNKNWQAINVTKPCDALSMMYTGNATGLYINSGENMTPLKWMDWIKLPCIDERCIKTVRGNILIPKIIILCNFNRVPKKRPKFTAKNLWQRDRGICQYTGKKLKPNEGNIDHVTPRSKGGQTTWENCVLAHKSINSEKADRTPEEAGLTLIRKPYTPRELPTSCYIKNVYGIKEWEIFLVRSSN